MNSQELSQIKNMIYIVRQQRVMLDSDLANLYGVETKRLNEAVKRNISRFPPDFMFQLNTPEFEILRSQFATSSGEHGGRRALPYVFTECGVAMLSSALKSERAAQVNIAIMRTFVKLRSFLAIESTLSEKISNLEKDTHQLFKVVFQRLDGLEHTLPNHSKNRKRIGIKN